MTAQLETKMEFSHEHFGAAGRFGQVVSRLVYDRTSDFNVRPNTEHLHFWPNVRSAERSAEHLKSNIAFKN